MLHSRTWIETDHLRAILEDDEYRPIDRYGLQQGDIVVYKDNHNEDSHVAIVFEVKLNLVDATFEVVVLSQWGQDGEYLHKDDDVNPQLGTPTEYWTDRT